MMLPRRLETSRLVLRAGSAGDGAMANEAIVETFAQLHLWMPWAQVLPTVEESERYVIEAARKWEAETQLDFSVLLRIDESVFLGRIGIWPLEEEAAFEIGYWCRASMQRQNYTAEAAQAVSEAAHKYLGARKLVIRCDSRNIASQKVALRCGFALGETRRGDAVANDGSVRDTMIFTMIFVRLPST